MRCRKIASIRANIEASNTEAEGEDRRQMEMEEQTLAAELVAVKFTKEEAIGKKRN